MGEISKRAVDLIGGSGGHVFILAFPASGQGQGVIPDEQTIQSKGKRGAEAVLFARHGRSPGESRLENHEPECPNYPGGVRQQHGICRCRYGRRYRSDRNVWPLTLEQHPFILNQAQALSFRGREAEPGTHEHRSLRTVARRLRRRVYGSRALLRSPGMTEPGMGHLERILL